MHRIVIVTHIVICSICSDMHAFLFLQKIKIWLDLILLLIEIKDGFTSLHHLDLAPGYQLSVTSQ